MTPESVLSIGREALQVLLIVSAPLLLVTLAVGVIVSIFQAATQINEMTLSFIPKLLAIFGVLVVAGPWMLGYLLDYMHRMFANIPFLIG
jgi:flagellar biosynthesis protein FliQ